MSIRLPCCAVYTERKPLDTLLHHNFVEFEAQRGAFAFAGGHERCAKKRLVPQSGGTTIHERHLRGPSYYYWGHGNRKYSKGRH